MTFETLASGYGLIEGPTVDPAGGIIFSDVLGGGVHRLDPAGEVTTLVPKRRGVGGIALHADGGIVISGRDLSHVKDGRTETLLAIAGVAGWNDICADSRGRVLAGALRFPVFDPNAVVRPGECWRIDLLGRATVLFDNVLHANGIALSPDERTLYCSDSRASVIVVHDVEADGRLRNRREIESEGPGSPDGMAVDQDGCIWVASAGGGRVDRFLPDGRLERSLAVPASFVTSVCFAGNDRRDLIIVTADNTESPDRKGTIFRTRVDVAGAPVHPARTHLRGM